MGISNKEYEDPGIIRIILYQVAALAAIIFLPAICIVALIYNTYDCWRRRVRQKHAREKTVLVFVICTVGPAYVTQRHCVFILQRTTSAYRYIRSFFALRRPSAPLNLDALEKAGTLYHYHPLERERAIRLLRILPATSFQDPLLVKLETTDLDTSKSYDALSYTWGDEETGDVQRSKVLRCTNGTIIPITRNCEAAIRRLRLREKVRLTWIDAVCIDQASELERTQQVSLMGDIYSSAAHVVVYTGEGTEKTDRLFDWLNSIDDNGLNIASPWTWEDLSSKELQYLGSRTRYGIQWNRIKIYMVDVSRNARWFWRSQTTTERSTLSDWEVQFLVEDFCSRRYFKRVWTLQEVALPSPDRISLLCGSNTTTAERALHVISSSQLQDETSRRVLHVFRLFRQRIPHPDRSHLLDMLLASQDRESSDPRDKIFGILGITKHMDECPFPELKPDYTKSTAEVYTSFSAFFIRHHGPAFFLSLIKSPSQRPNLPSWSADWTMPWPNNRSVGRRDFAAGSKPTTNFDSGASFTIGARYLTLFRPRVFQGYYTWDGHIDGSQRTTITQVEDLMPNHVLIEMFPGAAALLERSHGEYVFKRICPHGLSEESVRRRARIWSTVIAGEETDQRSSEKEEWSSEYKSPSEPFLIQ